MIYIYTVYHYIYIYSYMCDNMCIYINKYPQIVASLGYDK